MDKQGAGFTPSFCIHVRPFVGRYVDGTLPATLKWLVQLHIGRCRTCQKALDSLKQLVNALRTLNTHSAPDELREQRLSKERWKQLEEAWIKAEQPFENEKPSL